MSNYDEAEQALGESVAAQRMAQESKPIYEEMIRVAQVNALQAIAFALIDIRDEMRKGDENDR